MSADQTTSGTVPSQNAPAAATASAARDSTAADNLPYDSILFVSFGGPERKEDVIPFLENVLRGRPVPRERMLEVAEHYYHFGGVSPINEQCRQMIAAVQPLLREAGITLPVYWGNRNWHPLLTETVAQMARDGRKRAVAFVTASTSSYSGCRQYRENIIAAREAFGPDAPQIDKIRVFYNHPLFISAGAGRLQEALEQIPAERRSQVQIAFSAHSIPMSMANGCPYVPQLEEACRLVTEAVGIAPGQWKLVYQSRSGRPEDPWLEPDIGDYLRSLKAAGVTDVIVDPIGFLSDHMEVMFDLDEEARLICEEIGLNMVRAGTVGTHPDFIRMIRDLIAERISGTNDRPAIGRFPASHDVCPVHCCPVPVRPATGRPGAHQPAAGAPDSAPSSSARPSTRP